MEALTFVKRKFICSRYLANSFHKLGNFIVSELIAARGLDSIVSNGIQSIHSQFFFSTSEALLKTIQLCLKFVRPHLSNTSKSRIIGKMLLRK